MLLGSAIRCGSTWRKRKQTLIETLIHSPMIMFSSDRLQQFEGIGAMHASKINKLMVWVTKSMVSLPEADGVIQQK